MTSLLPRVLRRYAKRLPRGVAVAGHVPADRTPEQLAADVAFALRRATGWPSAAQVARVAAEQSYPRLRVTRSPGGWYWEVVDPGGRVLDWAGASTHAMALALGLAALECHSLTYA